jgi:hypothetical protein
VAHRVVTAVASRLSVSIEVFPMDQDKISTKPPPPSQDWVPRVFVAAIGVSAVIAGIVFDSALLATVGGAFAGWTIPFSGGD